MKYTLKNKEIELTDDEVQEIIKQNSKPVEEKVIGISIKNRFTGETIYHSTKNTLKEAVEEGRANLYGANLTEADLYGADLTEADLMGAKFRGKTPFPKILTKKQLPDFLGALGFKIEE